MSVAVIIPCLNEARNIGQVLDSLCEQNFKDFEVVIADGMSKDGTLRIVESYIESGLLRIKVVLNPRISTPSGLNLAVRNTNARIIIRLDSHAKFDEEYLEKMVSYFKNSSFDVIGPQVKYFPGDENSVVAKIICEFINSKVGNGGTPSRNALSKPIRTEHTVMSCYRREVWEHIAGYDEELLSNEDFDFDYRAHKAGFRVFSLPEPVYFAKARSELKSFARQRVRYGYWKAMVVQKHPESLKLRQVAPVIFTIFLILSSVFPPLLFFILTSYAMVVLSLLRRIVAHVAGIYGTSRASVGFKLLLVALITHCCWSLGFLYGMLRPRRRDA